MTAEQDKPGRMPCEHLYACPFCLAWHRGELEKARTAESAARKRALEEAAKALCPECRAGLPAVRAEDDLEILSKPYASPNDIVHRLSKDSLWVKCRAAAARKLAREEGK